jgi:hypothetical protein
MYLRYSDGTTDRRTSDVAWSVIPSSLGMIDRSGSFTASRTYTGSGTIRGSVGTYNATLQLSVAKPVQTQPRAPARTVTSVYLSPPSKTTFTQGESASYAMYFRYSDGTTEKRTSDVVWSVTPSSLGTIDRSGSFTASRTYTGSGTIRGNAGAYNATLQLSVAKPVQAQPRVPARTVTSVYISPPSKTTFTQGESATYAMYLQYSDNTFARWATSDIQWSVNPNDMGTFDRSGQYNVQFNASRTKSGPATITAVRSDGKKATLQISVQKSIDSRANSGKSQEPVKATSPSGISSDRYEVDDIKNQVKTISEGEVQTRTIYPAGDVDWILFRPRSRGIYHVLFHDLTVDLSGKGYVKQGALPLMATDTFYVNRPGGPPLCQLDADGANYFYLEVHAKNQGQSGSYRTKIQFQPKEVVYPTTSGITWKRGNNYTIRWKGFPVSTIVKIELYKGSSLNRTIASSMPNSGSRSWLVPRDQMTGSDFRIKITSKSDSSQYDFSDGYFTIN